MGSIAKKFREEGIAEGIEQGKAIGVTHGIAVGQKQKANHVAINLLKNGLPIKTILK